MTPSTLGGGSERGEENDGKWIEERSGKWEREVKRGNGETAKERGESDGKSEKETSGKLEREVRIHPFFDGNGRTARLFMNLILRRGMGREPVTLDEEWRQEYYRCLRERDLASFEAEIHRLINLQGGND
ncbi:hypothetical protein niasHT_018242 [Heterodera trifolii]|uniref:Fido domain-containing protein n=1 Tax=Heterodera trifolii TaxID=157864 RepID=A0ABD2L674_9BILA